MKVYPECQLDLIKYDNHGGARMIGLSRTRTARDLVPKIERLFEVSAAKIRALEDRWTPSDGAPVSTIEGRYAARGWTEWTQGFQFGAAILQFDATGDREFLALGRSRTIERMASHLTHVGVHDHGFNNVSTYGSLWRLAREGRIDASDWELHFYELALKVSGAVQARRWTAIPGGGFIHSFNGAHSLFVDTMRSLRALALSHRLGHRLSDEQDRQVGLLDRLIQHASATAEWNIYYGAGRDAYDVRGRTAHESLFNAANGSYRGPSSQQGYSPFTTWTRGLAWAVLGFAEQIEFLATLSDDELSPAGGRAEVDRWMFNAALATADYYLAVAASDGVPYWDSGAPGLAALGEWGSRPADPFNEHEPVDSSAAAIAAQGLLRLGRSVRRVAATARATSRRATASSTRCSIHRARISPPTRGTKGCSCIRSTIGPTTGITFRLAAASRAANRASGATIMPGKRLFTCCGSRAASPTWRSSGVDVRVRWRT